jgi:hypothetical protein
MTPRHGGYRPVHRPPPLELAFRLTVAAAILVVMALAVVGQT